MHLAEPYFLSCENPQRASASPSQLAARNVHNPPRVRHANHRLYITQAPLEHLVPPDLSHVPEPKEGVVREDDLDPERARVEDALHALGTEGSVGVEDVDLLAQEDVADVGEGGEEAGEGGVDVRWREGVDGDVVDLDTVGEVADSAAWWVGMGDDDDLG